MCWGLRPRASDDTVRDRGPELVGLATSMAAEGEAMRQSASHPMTRGSTASHCAGRTPFSPNSGAEPSVRSPRTGCRTHAVELDLPIEQRPSGPHGSRPLRQGCSLHYHPALGRGRHARLHAIPIGPWAANSTRRAPCGASPSRPHDGRSLGMTEGSRGSHRLNSTTSIGRTPRTSSCTQASRLQSNTSVPSGMQGTHRRGD